MKTAKILVGCAFVLGVCSIAWSDGIVRPSHGTEKKLIEYGWDVPTPDYIREHIREMEEKPFDGLIFKLKTSVNVLDPVPLDTVGFEKDCDNLAHIDWRKFSDNFLIMWAASKQDWFNDEHWTVIVKNTALMARAAKMANCVGICFDPEPYGNNPWEYKTVEHKDTKSFSEYQAKVRERGAQFQKAIESEFPGPRMLQFYLLALFKRLCVPMDPAEREKELADHSYSLFPSFFAGMLEAAGAETVFIDGNENAYYYTNSEEYFNAYHLITQRALYMLPPSLWDTYRAKTAVGQALYMDQYFGLRAQRVLGNFMTDEEQVKWLEHNTYWALYSTDEYVWCYSEKMDWWKNKGVPEKSEDAIRSARSKVSSGQDLGFDFAPIAKAADRRKDGAL